MKLSFALLLVFLLAACSVAEPTRPPPTATTEQRTATSPPASATPPLPTATVPPTETSAPAPTPTPPQPWWNETVFYQLTVRSFFDSNGDGFGDFNGLVEKLDYLNDGDPATTDDLGITGLWLLPIHPSPSDHGFDVTDYYAVNPDYGTLDDFRRLVSEAHRRGIRLIIDLVINHSSSQHPWFIQSQEPDSPYRDWYVWSPGDPGFKGPWGQQVWYPLQGDYYYAYFWEGMPDLNYRNPAVTAEMEQITKFWLTDVGIDGFRLDAIGALIEDGSVTVETQATHDWFANYYRFYKALQPEAMTIGEVWREDAVVVPWVANQQVDLAFEFDLAAAMVASVNEGDTGRLLKTLRSGTRNFPAGQYGIFLANHDMTRVITQLGDDPQKARVAASVYLSLPGVPFIYYGEEIGMRNLPPDRLLLPPMQWSGGPYAGFSESKPWEAVEVDPQFNVAAETSDPDSLLSHYRRLIALRRSHPALQTGALSLPSTNNPGLFACLRTIDGEAVLVLVNLTGAPIADYRLSLPISALPPGEYTPSGLLGDSPAAPLTVLGKGRILNYVPLPEIPAYGTRMIRFESRFSNP